MARNKKTHNNPKAVRKPRRALDIPIISIATYHPAGAVRCGDCAHFRPNVANPEDGMGRCTQKASPWENTASGKRTRTENELAVLDGWADSTLAVKPMGRRGPPPWPRVLRFCKRFDPKEEPLPVGCASGSEMGVVFAYVSDDGQSDH